MFLLLHDIQESKSSTRQDIGIWYHIWRNAQTWMPVRQFFQLHIFEEISCTLISFSLIFIYSLCLSLLFIHYHTVLMSESKRDVTPAVTPLELRLFFTQPSIYIIPLLAPLVTQHLRGHLCIELMDMIFCPLIIMSYLICNKRTGTLGILREEFSDVFVWYTTKAQYLAQWLLNKMAALWQTSFWNMFLWKKMFKF